jgi:hypothetical protein
MRELLFSPDWSGPHANAWRFCSRWAGRGVLRAISDNLKVVEDWAGYAEAIPTGRRSCVLRRKTEGCYTQDVFECPAKLGRALAANSVRFRVSPE